MGAVVTKVVQECQNGLVARCYVFRREELAAPSLEQVSVLAQRLDARLWRRPDGIDLQVPRACVSVREKSDLVIVAGHRLSRASSAHSAPGGRTREAVAAPSPDQVTGAALSDPSLGPYERALLIAAVDPETATSSVTDALRALREDESLVVQVLASECLNRQGEPAIPQLIWDRQIDTAQRQPTREAFTESFEAQISVDEYACHEAVHPGYAEQVLELARMARAFVPPAERLLDVGSGPGLPTIMLTELFPSAQVTAVEPSPVAFEHLRANVAGLPVTPTMAAVQDVPGEGSYDVVVSVGTSHHLDTREFLRACRRLVEPDGLVLVADEMIDPFDTEEERAAALIRHHWVYVRDVLANVEERQLPPPERDRVRGFRELRQPTPDALFWLLERAGHDRGLRRDRSPWPRARLAVLELEALVAGIGYDVERKTYPENFLALAADAGLELVDHTRVYPTSGDHPFAAGTHAFCLRRV